MTFPMILTDPLAILQGHSIFEVEYLKNGAFHEQCFYRTRIGNNPQSIEWYHFQ